MTQLKRSLNLPLLTFYGLGNILGAGIHVLVGKVAGQAGMYTAVAFIVASVVATFTAFSYAELSARYPVSAGEAVYIYEGTRRQWLAMSVGLLIAMAGVVSAATISLGFIKVRLPTPAGVRTYPFWLPVCGVFFSICLISMELLF